MARMAQNEMKAMRDMPLRVRSTEGLGVGWRGAGIDGIDEGRCCSEGITGFVGVSRMKCSPNDSDVECTRIELGVLGAVLEQAIDAADDGVLKLTWNDGFRNLPGNLDRCQVSWLHQQDHMAETAYRS